MLKQIQELILQVEQFLSDKEGFSTEISHAGAVIDVTNPSGEKTQYDGYELLLYTLGIRKLGSDIKLNINSTEDGKEVFAVNSDATYNLSEYILRENSKTLVYPDEIHSVVMSVQTAGTPFPYCVTTFTKKGTWLRYDLTLSELLYAAVHGIQLEHQEDGSFAFTKLRELSRKLQDEIAKELE